MQANKLAVGDTNGDGQLTSADQPNINGDIRLKPQSGNPSTWSSGKQGEVGYASTDGYLYAYNGSAWVKQGGGAIVQTARSSTGNYFDTSSTYIPFDNTIPQITEGMQILSVNITPQNANNTLCIRVSVNVFNYDVVGTVALFQVGNSNALAAVGVGDGQNTLGYNIAAIDYRMTAGTTNQITFTVRVGATITGRQFAVNGPYGTGQLYGGVAASSITIDEIEQ